MLQKTYGRIPIETHSEIERKWWCTAQWRRKNIQSRMDCVVPSFDVHMTKPPILGLCIYASIRSFNRVRLIGCQGRGGLKLLSSPCFGFDGENGIEETDGF